MRRFQNKVSESAVTLPFVAVTGIIVTIVAGMSAGCNYWLCAASLAISTILMMEMNNRNMLLRVRSRMVSCSYVVLTLMTATVSVDMNSALLQLCFSTLIFLLTISCQQKDSVGRAFYAILLISTASFIWSKVLFLIPVVILLMIRPLYCLSFRAVSAMVMAVLLPYIIDAVRVLYADNFVFVDKHYINELNGVMQVLDPSGFLDYSQVSPVHIATVVFLIIIAMFGTLHFMKNSFMDKIRVRMIYWTLVIVTLFLSAAIILFPVYYSYLAPMLCVPVAAISAHFFTHTSSRFTNWVFIIFLVLVILLTIANHLIVLDLWPIH